MSETGSIEGWARYWARRYSWALRDRAYLDFDDLQSAATIGILAALEKYDAANGVPWAVFSSGYIRKEIRALIGIKRKDLPPATVSLDAPLTNADSVDGDTTLLDTVADESLPEIDDGALLSDLCASVRAAVADLKDPRQREIVRRAALEGETQGDLATALAISPQRVAQLWTKARKALARDPRLRVYAEIEARTPYYMTVSPQRFQSTHTSPVEHAVLWRETQLGTASETTVKG